MGNEFFCLGLIFFTYCLNIILVSQTIFNRQGVLSNTIRNIFVCLIYFFGFMYMKILYYFIAMSIINSLIIYPIIKDWKLSNIALKEKYKCINKAKYFLNAGQNLLLVSIMYGLVSYVSLDLMDEPGPHRPDFSYLYTIKDLSLFEIIDMLNHNKKVIMSDSIEDFVTNRNKDRIYNSINCGLKSREECQQLKSRYL